MADELDKVLEQQRQRAQRRVYSQQAVLDRAQGEEIERGLSSQQQRIEDRLRVMETEGNAPSTIRPVAHPPARPPAPAIRPDASRNWLTPAMLDQSAEWSLEQDADDDPFALDSWRPDESGRASLFSPGDQPFQRPGMAAEDDSRILPQSRALNSYFQPFTSPSTAVDTPSTPRYGVPLRSSQQTGSSERISPFSPEAVRSAAQPPSRTPGWPAPAASPFDRAPSGNATGSLPQPSQRPIDILRRSTPVYRGNPFEQEWTRPDRGLWE